MIIALQLILSLSILIVLHEMGHFVPAKLFNTRVEKFYLFFDPKFSLFKKKIGETEYGIGWLPLGGYVKISGMIDESMDKEQMKQEPKPWEFRSKPAWQRLIIMVGGVVVNLILGVLIYTIVLFTWGKTIVPVQNIEYGFEVAPLMESFGFEDGDKILALNGEEPLSYEMIGPKLLLDDIETITVERNGEVMDFALPNDFGQMMVDSSLQRPFWVRLPSIIASFSGDSSAYKAGLRLDDRIVALNGKELEFFSQLREELSQHKEEIVMLTVVRGADTLMIEKELDKEGLIGFRPKSPTQLFEKEEISYTFMESIPAGIKEAREKLMGYVVSMKFLASESGAKQVGGFYSIAKIFPNEWDWRIFWVNTAWLSLILAFMNILPIPALDGGHVMFLLYEMVAGKPPRQKVMEIAQMVGFVLLLGLLIFANGNDLVKIYKDFFAN